MDDSEMMKRFAKYVGLRKHGKAAKPGREKSGPLSGKHSGKKKKGKVAKKHAAEPSGYNSAARRAMPRRAGPFARRATKPRPFSGAPYGLNPQSCALRCASRKGVQPVRRDAP